jgi:UPF0271 protein
MATVINLNADVAEGWGAYDIGNDTELIKIIRSANVACGFHAGDWNTMHRICLLAKEHGISIGAHPSFNDLWGFGRRQIKMKASDVEYMVAYQIGALQAIAAYAGLKVTHLKPHGALSNMAAKDESTALAIGRAIKTVDPTIIYLAQAATELEKAAITLGLPFAREGFADRQYEDDLTLASRAIPGAVTRDPAAAGEQALRLARDGQVVSRHGKVLKLEVDTICVHGDEPTAVAVGRAVKERLQADGIRIVTLTEVARRR